jgi:SAM-dependent methyltransferase
MVLHAGLSGSEHVLDAGSGAGHTALAFAPCVAHVISVDLSQAMLEQGERLAAERGLTNIEFRQADVESLPFADSTFDLIVSRYSAHHWPHPQAALAEFRRLLQPGGCLLLDDIVSYDDFTCDTHLQAIELLRDRSHVRDHTAAAWIALLAQAGFAAEVVFTWSLRLDFGAWVQRMATPAEDVAAIRRLLDHAPAEVRDLLCVEADHSFALPGALIKGTLR